jgi:hypothetical protein
MHPTLLSQVQSWFDVDTGTFIRHVEDANHDDDAGLIRLREGDLDVVGLVLGPVDKPGGGRQPSGMSSVA